MNVRDVIEMIVRSYGGCVTPGVNWTWAMFDDPTRGHFAYEEITIRFPSLDTRGYDAYGFRYRY